MGVAIFHHHALTVALTGLAAIVAYKLVFTGFREGAGLQGLVGHFGDEWVMLANLTLLLVGFAVLAHHFEESNLPHAVPRLLPDGLLGGLALLALVFCLSIFLDNIAAAILGGVVARHVYGGKLCVAYLASIVAAANAGGAGSVIGDTTTTMMWLSGISPLTLVELSYRPRPPLSCSAFWELSPSSVTRQLCSTRRRRWRSIGAVRSWLPWS
jgi:Na+/H+ antiporter NhaD/arsenite permease-like protein